ncbi:hypothetical protein OAS86_05280 [Gammaproteobacteria bacterium]|nr:hypothetical protein [Gammaproteobacteria bacterium]
MILRLIGAVIVAIILMIAYRVFSQRQIAKRSHRATATPVSPEQDRLLWLLSISAIAAALALITLHWRSENIGLWVVITENGVQRELRVESIDFPRQRLILDDGEELPLSQERQLVRASDRRP